jgi:glycosyltransferase involved in cell wall biosynthesis
LALTELPASASLGARLHHDLPQVGDGRRVLHIATRHLRGGAERNLAHFVDWEVAAGYDVDVALGRESEATGFPDGVRIHQVDSLVRDISPLRDLLAIRGLRSLIRAGRYEMVHTHLSKAGIVGRLAARDLARRIVHTVHMASFGPGYQPIASMAFRLAERRCAAFADAIAFVGTDLLQLYRRAGIGNREGSVVIRSPIEIERFLATRSWDRARRTEVRRRLGIHPDRPLIIAIGALEARKRYELMINALLPMLSAGEVILAIAGEGKERSALERLTARNRIAGHVQFLGHVESASGPLAAADLLVHASSVEGVPQVVIQALAAGKPVVATDVTGLREVAGAPVTVIPISGKGLMAAVAARLKDPPAPVAANVFSAWTCPSIDAEIAAFHARFDA